MLPRSSCAFCRVKFTPEEKERGLKLHSDCIGPYAESFAARQLRRKVAKAKQEKAKEARDLRARKQALKTIPDLIKEAQHEFNRYVRLRDSGQPCICCGQPLGDGEVGGAYDCGHYRSTGSAPHLRFDERNANAQRKACNRWGAGRAVDYRIGLIQRIGLAEVEALEADNRIHKWQRDELIAIRDKYRQKLKELKSQHEDSQHHI